MLLDHANQTFDQCIKCTVCTAYCPVAKANPAYPGPKQAGPDGERLRIKSPELFDSALKYCTNCKRCEVACPSGVRIGDIIAKAKHQYSGFKPGIREFVLSHTDLMGSMSTLMAPVVNFTTGLKPMKLVLDKALGSPPIATCPSTPVALSAAGTRSRKRVRPALRVKSPTSTAATSTTTTRSLARSWCRCSTP